MADQDIANDYAGYFNKANISNEIRPISSNIDEMMTRLDEFETILQIVKNDAAVTVNDNIPRILTHKPEFDRLCRRIDDLEKFVELASQNLTAMEKQIQIAEEELDIPDKAFNVFLKSINIFGKPKLKETNLDDTGKYVPAEIFKTSDYFPAEPSAKTD